MVSIYIKESGLKKLLTWAFRKSYKKKNTELLDFRIILRICYMSSFMYLAIKDIVEGRIRDFGVGLRAKDPSNLFISQLIKETLKI